MYKPLLCGALAASGVLFSLHAAKAPRSAPPPEVAAALDRISAKSLRGNLSFLASDALEGRGTPSRGLDIAAEFIASQFRRAGLEPPVNGDYFQTASMIVRRPVLDGFRLELTSGKRTASAGSENAMIETSAAIDLKAAAVVKLMAASSPKPESLDGKVVVVDWRDADSQRELLRKAHPALILMVAHNGPEGAFPKQALVDPSQPDNSSPRIILFSPKLATFIGDLKAGESATASIHIAAPAEQCATVRNVLGILRGSDAALKDTYVLVTAHYDHLGVEGGRVYNGADDDGSGTASVIEIANALAGLKNHPARSIVFMTFFGEEEGLIGSEYYVHHPVFPLARTVADVNLEQLGRTDSTKGKEIANAAPTGFGFSTMVEDFREAGAETGIKVYDQEPESDRYFAQSDNLSFAEAGIPAHTFCVAFQYPDYHGLGDKWQKVDYENMAKVDRMLALGITMLADNAAPPHWNAANAQAKRYAAKR